MDHQTPAADPRIDEILHLLRSSVPSSSNIPASSYSHVDKLQGTIVKNQSIDDTEVYTNEILPTCDKSVGKRDGTDAAAAAATAFAADAANGKSSIIQRGRTLERVPRRR